VSEPVVYECTLLKWKTMADGSWRAEIDFGDLGGAPKIMPRERVAVALLGPIINGEAGDPPAGNPPSPPPEQDIGSRRPDVSRPRHPYGASARELKLSGFCRSPDVWRAVGTDEEFLRWVRTQPCAARRFGPCEGDVVAAHVRRIANGAGMGVKPKDFSAIPLCHRHHMLQHQHGEERLAPKAQWDEWRIQYVEQWAWESLRSLLGYESMGDVPPAVLHAWAETHGLDRYLPLAYRQ
jgi:hypothetical protein